MSNILVVAYLLIILIYCIIIPSASWYFVRRTFPRRRARLEGEPDFPVNLIVPCKGAGEHLEENLRAIAAQDYPMLRLRFVTDTPDDPAVPIIMKIIGETGRGVHLVAGRDDYNTCGKNYAQLVAIADDADSEVHLVCDSDMRPTPDFVREMTRPYLDPAVNVTCATRWITSTNRSLGAYTYAGLGAFSPMLMAFGLITYVWGGCFSIRRKAFEDWDVARAWRGTEDDDLVLCNKLNEHRQKPCFVPSAVSASHEAHTSLRGLVRWLTRQGQTTRLHYLPVWILVTLLETLVSLGILGALAYTVFALATGTVSWILAAALGSLLMIMANGLLVWAPYAERDSMPLAFWLLIPLVGHIVVALSFLLAVNPTMRWGKMTLTFNKDGTIREILNREI